MCLMASEVKTLNEGAANDRCVEINCGLLSETGLTLNLP